LPRRSPRGDSVGPPESVLSEEEVIAKVSRQVSPLQTIEYTAVSALPVFWQTLAKKSQQVVHAAGGRIMRS